VELAANGTCWVAEATTQLDYVVVTGPSYADILTRYADLTGYPPLLPDWALGFWQSKLRYRTQDELLDVAREYHRRGLPLAVIVIDFFHWTHMGDWQFNAADWPDPAAMVKELESIGVKLMVSVWPSVNPESVNFTEMKNRGFLVNTERGVLAHSVFLDVDSPAAVYLAYFDPTNPAARSFVWDRLRNNYFACGIRAWWLDACEPEINPQDHDNLRYFLGNGAAVGCLYPLRYQQMFYDGMLFEGETEVVLLSRSAWAGSQRYGAIVWSGDIPSTFPALQRQVSAGLNMAMSGIPWWTTDIGGFQGGDIRDPAFHELVVRWFQFAVFCPVLRLHGYREPGLGHLESGAGNEVWSFGDRAYGAIRTLLSLRERLRPYLAEQMKIAHEYGIPPMRPLFFDFAADPLCATVEDQFMLGADLLVAPVLTAGATSRRLYLPHGTAWLRPDTGEVHPGGDYITVDAPLAVVPFYVRSSSGLALHFL
jgi:alpha-D-xyloside xylohydrolase